jgi:hypothetical protein
MSASRDLTLDILMKPLEYSVEVPNANFPAGALRGQLAK